MRNPIGPFMVTTLLLITFLLLTNYAYGKTKSEWLNVLIANTSQYLLNTLAVSLIGSPLPICEVFGFKSIVVPPSLDIATWKLTLVRVEDLSKINPNTLFLSSI